MGLIRSQAGVPPGGNEASTFFVARAARAPSRAGAVLLSQGRGMQVGAHKFPGLRIELRGSVGDARLKGIRG
jgi:hypothetical protein